ncbi:MAG: HAD family hydrolase [Thermoanaerobaculales bacterium]
MASAINAIVFDVYGTLLEIADPFMRRRVPGLLGVPPRDWISLVREHLLTTDFGNLSNFADFLCRSLTVVGDEELRSACVEAIEAELAAVRPFPGALPLLKFLRRRGLKLGLVSNLSTAHALPLEDLGLRGLADATALSFEVGLVKPDPKIFRLIARRLAVDPSDALVIGDSLANDVRAPAALGFATVHVGSGDGSVSVDKVADVGMLALFGPEPLRPLLGVGHEVELADGRFEVKRLDPVPDEMQGRYNLVWRLEVAPVGSDQDPAFERLFFAKRYRFPESAHVEAFARQVLARAGFEVPETLVLDGAEPVLLSEAVGGAPYAGELEPEIGAELARHMVFAYVFSNADIRPRNAFLDRTSGRPVINVIDLEHCFLNRALDVSRLPEPFDPKAIDALGETAVESLVRRQVLTDKTLRRGRGEFFDTETAPVEFVSAYRRGFVETFERFQDLGEELTSFVADRVYTSPPLVVGTRRYRRAMAGIDLQDIRTRLSEDPHEVVDRVLG